MSHAPDTTALPRRRFLQLATLAGAGAATLSRPFLGWDVVFAQTTDTPFAYGVAAGDPLPDRVMIWTRVTPSADATPGSGLGVDAPVTWQVSTRRDFSSLVAFGNVTATSAQDHTVKVDVTGLLPRTSYFYRFLFNNVASRTGQMRTAPATGAAVGSLRFGVTSCSNYEGGFFAAYRYLAQRNDLDFVMHLGDYIYEYETGGYGPGPAIGRVHDPANEIVSLSDYRRRHALHKLDPDLQLLHARHPFITTWDDHEVTNDAYRTGAENHEPLDEPDTPALDPEGDFLERRGRSYQAYFEWMPIRLPDPVNAPTQIYRRFEFGNLVDLSMLDLRQYRDQQAANGAVLTPDLTDPIDRRVIDDPARTLTGREQLDWFKSNLTRSTTRWKLVGNSIMVSPIDFSAPGVPTTVLAAINAMMGVPYNVDQWDGYRADRRELLNHVAGNAADGQPVVGKINNVVFLTGDIHSSWACDIPRDPGAYPATSASVAVEFVGTSITADNLDEIINDQRAAAGLPPLPPRTASLGVENIFKASNRHVKLLEFDSHGYSVVDVNPERVQMDWYYIADRTNPNTTQRFANAWLTRAGTNTVQPAAGPLGPRPLA